MISQVHRICAEVWSDKTDIRLSDVIEQTVELDPEFEVTGGRYDLTNNPYWREPIDNFLDDDVNEISVMKSTRVGGTLTLNAVALALSKVAPASGMLVVPDELEAKECRNRIYGTAEVSPEYKDQVPIERWRNMSEISLAGGAMKIKLAWSGSAQRLRGKTIKYLFRSEIDVFAPTTSKGGDPLKASFQRTGRIPNFKVYDESTPDGDPSNIDTRYRAGNQSEWYCPCPICGTYQSLNFFTNNGVGGFAGYTDTDDPRDKNARLLTNLDEIRVKTYYRCIKGCKFYNHQKHSAVVKGLWVPRGQRVDKSGRLRGVPEAGKRHSSYYLWKVHVRDFSLGEIAANYVQAYKEGKLKDFWQNDVGRRWRVGRKVQDWRKLGARLQSFYKRGTVPKEAWFLTGAADVQLDGCYYQVWAWGDGGTHWLIEWGFVQRYEGSEEYVRAQQSQDEQNDSTDINAEEITSDLKQLTTVLVKRYFQVEGGENPLGEKRMRCRLINCDTNYRTRDVQQWVYSHHPWPKDEVYDQHDVVRCVRGDHKVKRSEKYKPATVEAPQRGGPAYVGGMRLWRIYAIHYKDEFANRSIMRRGSRGSMAFPATILSEGEEFLKQITNEKKVDKEDTQTKRMVETYVVIDRGIGNHYADGYGYAFAAADMHLDRLGLTWDAETWKPRPAPIHEEQEAIESVAVRDYM